MFENQDFENADVAVEVRPRWWMALPVGAVLLLVAVAVVTATGPDPVDQVSPTTAFRISTLVVETTAAPVEAATTTSRPARSTTTLADSIEIEGQEFPGAVYAFWRQGVMKVDLTSGDVTRAMLGEAWMVRSAGDRLVVVGNRVAVTDLNLELLFDVSGQFLAADDESLWVSRRQSDGEHELQRYNRDGELDLTVRASTAWLHAAFRGQDLHVASQNGQWLIADDGEITAVAANEPRLQAFNFESGTYTICSSTTIECEFLVMRSGEMVRIPSTEMLYRVRQSHSGRFVIADGPGGTPIIDLDGEDIHESVRAGPEDEWAVGADVLIRVSGRQLTAVEPLSGALQVWQLPSDIQLHQFPVLVVIDAERYVSLPGP